MVKNSQTFLHENQKSIMLLVGALALYIVSLYISVPIFNWANAHCSPFAYTMVKATVKWARLLIPLFFMKMEHITFADIGITTDKLPAQATTGIVIGSIEAFVILGLAVLFGGKAQLGKPMYEEGWLYAIYFFYAIFVIGLQEEIFHRGYIFTKLLDIKDSKWFASIISSVIFGMCHAVGYDHFLQALPQVLFTTMAGVIYCILREKVKGFTLTTLIFMHGVYDFWVAFLAFVFN